MKSRAFAVAALLFAAGCGGGGSSPGTGPNPGPPPPVQTLPPAAANTATLTLVFPLGRSPASTAKHPLFVSPNSAKLDVLIKQVNGAAPPAWVPADTLITLTVGGNCTVSGGTETCTVTVPAPPGSVEYDFTVTDSSKNPLANNDVTKTIAQGTGNTLTVTLQGIAQAVTVTAPTLNANTPLAGSALTLVANDASSAQIVDGTTTAPFANPYTLTDNDSSGQTSLSVTSAFHAAQSGTTVTVYGPGDTVNIVYSGRAANPFTFTVGGSGFTAPDANVNTLGAPSGTGNVSTTVQDITFTGTTIDDTAHGGLVGDANYNQQTLFFSANSGTQNITAAELGWSNNFGAAGNKTFDLNLDAATCTNVAHTTTTGPALTYAIVAGPNTGTCKAHLVEDHTQPGTPITGHPASTAGVGPTKDGLFWITVTTASFTVN